jgi:hopanoid biosynthesis associated RND transporter like protein HpnN
MASRVDQLTTAAIARWIDSVASSPVRALLLIGVLTACALYYALTELGIDTDRADMLSPELAFRQHYETYKQAFPQYVDTFFLVIDADSPEQARRAAALVERRLATANRLFKTVWRPDAGKFFRRYGLLYLDEPALRDLADRLAEVQPFLGTVASDQSLRGLLRMTTLALEQAGAGAKLDLAPLLKAINDAIAANLHGRPYELSWQTLMLGSESPADANRLLILAQPRLDFGRLLPAEPAMQALRHIRQELQLDGSRSVKLCITGTAALEYEEMQSVARGAGLGALISLVLVTAVMLFGLRSPWLVFASLAALLISLILTAGFATLAVGRLNLISIAFAILNIGLGADYAIHLCLRYLELRDHGTPAGDALRAAASDVGSSLVMCAATTSVGFYAFVPTDYAGVSELGLIAGTGIFISLAVSLTVLPALLTLRRGQTRPQRSSPASARLREALAQWPFRHARAIRLAALVLAICAAIALPFARFDYNPLNLRDANSESVSTFRDLVEGSDTPPWSITILVDSAGKAQHITSRLRGLKTVSKVVTLRDFVPDHQAQKLAIITDLQLILGLDLATGYARGAPTFAQQMAALRELDRALENHLARTKGRARDLVAALQGNLKRLIKELEGRPPEAARERLHKLERSMIKNLPDTLSMLKAALTAGPVTLASLPAELTRHWRTPAGVYRVEVFPAEDLSASSALRSFVNEVRTVAPDATGLPVISLEAGQAVVSAFQQALITSLLVIGLLLWLLMRDLKDVALVLLPLLLGGMLTGAVIVLSGGTFNFANVIVLPLLLGIGVDNGIHMMHRLRGQLSAYGDLLRTSTARAVLYSALTTVVSFGNLAFSAHPGTASMGRLLTIGVLLTVATTLIVLPALLEPLEDKRQHAPHLS